MYGLHIVDERRSLWSELRSWHSGIHDPWISIGDYNAISNVTDREIGSLVQDWEIRDFNNFMEDAGIVEMKSTERNYTWTNGHTYSKLDRALVNTEWMLYMPHLEVLVMEPACSDHSPLSIKL